MEFDAVILAGGRSTRLGGVPKAGLKYDGATLLTHALQSARVAVAVVVVGPDAPALPAGVLTAREEPAFAGPAAAIAAGLVALRTRPTRSPWTLVLACDMPRAAAGVAALVEELAPLVEQLPPREEGPAVFGGGSEVEGAMAVSADGRSQPLLGIYSTAALEREVAVASAGSGLTNSSVFRLLARLKLLAVSVPGGSTDDVDTWDDAAALGIDSDS
ncbi:molybdenum cofactor guanylyltransferase [Paenarthrobacter sp. NPDC092416]|uniref:molybdenum cofactor guanylyltransferase n=1 Tax=Paenarthrobacter sp. NPDC092416 TaxID=3364386 RepID=UPI0038267CDA